MNLKITGRHIDIGDSLRAYAAEGLERATEKYFSSPIDAQVVFAQDGSSFKADVSVHIGRDIEMRASHDSQDIYAAFDGAVERMAKRLRRYKRRLRDHHGRAPQEGLEVYSARYYVLDPEREPEETHEGPVNDEALIIAEAQQQVPTLTPGNAAMRLDLSDSPVLLFKNAGHGGINVVYRRKDGNIGWLDPASR